jgi:hypothetical protein
MDAASNCFFSKLFRPLAHGTGDRIQAVILRFPKIRASVNKAMRHNERDTP